MIVMHNSTQHHKQAVKHDIAHLIEMQTVAAPADLFLGEMPPMPPPWFRHWTQSETLYLYHTNL